jgi:hypothetical protein
VRKASILVQEAWVYANSRRRAFRPMAPKRKTPPLYATRGEAPAPSSLFVSARAVEITLPDDPCSAPKGTPSGLLLRSTAHQRKEALTVPNPLRLPASLPGAVGSSAGRVAFASTSKRAGLEG